ncbi:hypothetical protein D3C72_2265120 [compost metagenome]
MHATPMAPPSERNRLVVLVATPMSLLATALCVPTSEVGNCSPQAIPVSSMNSALSNADCGGVSAIAKMATGISSAPARICGL